MRVWLIGVAAALGCGGEVTGNADGGETADATVAEVPDTPYENFYETGVAWDVTDPEVTLADNEAGLDTGGEVASEDIPPDPSDVSPDVEAETSVEITAEISDGSEVTVAEVIGPDVPPAPECEGVALITGPPDGDFVAKGEAFAVAAVVADGNGGALDMFYVQWETQSGVVLSVTPVAADGTTSGSVVLDTNGERELHARVLGPQNQVCEPDASVVTVQVCGHHSLETFDQALDPLEWQTFGDAYWDAGGWLEMTGNVGGHRGAIFSSDPQVAPGDVSFRFRFATGGGAIAGADGFAATIMKADDVAEVLAQITAAQGGGGLGYGIGGPYGPFVGDAFTVEIDTWYNQKNDAEWHTDPTQDDHIEITRGLDPSASLAFYALPDVETLEWHAVRIDVSATRVKVFYDGALVVDQDVPDLKFRGGYVFFSGSTGYYSNAHQFDDLEILDSCEAGAP